jgi:hypothetical protein
VMLAIVMTKLLNDIFQCENLNPWFCGWFSEWWLSESHEKAFIVPWIFFVMMITTLISQNLREVLNSIYEIFSSDCPDQIEVELVFHMQSYLCEFHAQSYLCMFHMKSYLCEFHIQTYLCEFHLRSYLRVLQMKSDLWVFHI